MTGSLRVLVLIAPARRRDDIVDVLLELDSVGGFSISSCGGYSRQHSHLNRREQVQGFGDYERFEVLCDTGTAEKILMSVRELAGRDSIRFWTTPLIDQGELGPV